MNNYLKQAVLAIAFMFTGASAYQGYISRQNQNDALAISHANISLCQAIALAEQHSNGTAARADYQYKDDSQFYDVEVLSNAKVFGVIVNASGTVMSSTEKKQHYDEEEYVGR